MKLLIAKMLTSSDDQIVRLCLISAQIGFDRRKLCEGIFVLNRGIIITESVYHAGCTHIHSPGVGREINRIAIRPFKDFKRLAGKETP